MMLSPSGTFAPCRDTVGLQRAGERTINGDVLLSCGAGGRNLPADDPPA